ncbi:MAG TPA: ATP-binding protein [Catenuloplanes sp.]|jgi:anti-sigma regulatory factor (Ser/Thr protein kinase)
MAEPPAPVSRLLCPLRVETLREVRREVESYARAAGLTDPRQLYNFVLAINELITNALHHAGGAGRLELWLEQRRLHCRVTDDGPGMPPERLVPGPRPDPGSSGGWGLWLVRQVCERVDIRTGRSGTRISVEYPLPRV